MPFSSPLAERDPKDAELQVPGHLTVDSLTAHSESTSSTLLYLLLSLLALPSSTLSHAASHLGAAQTFTTLLRALPFHAKNGRMVVPAEITAKHGVVQEEVFRRGPAAQGINDAVFEFATLANDHIITARNMLQQEGLPREAMPVFLVGVSVLVRSFRVIRLIYCVPFGRRCQCQVFSSNWKELTLMFSTLECR